jgi:nicotinamidase-related amidase
MVAIIPTKDGTQLYYKDWGAGQRRRRSDRTDRRFRPRHGESGQGREAKLKVYAGAPTVSPEPVAMRSTPTCWPFGGSETGPSAHSSPSQEMHMSMAKPAPAKTLLTPADHTLIMIDFQSQMAFATKSIDAVSLRNNAALVARAAGIFKVSTVLTTVAEKTFSGPMFDEIKAAFPKSRMLDRTSMNTWEDKAVIDEINRIGKSRLVLCGLWTSVCIVGPALSALDQGFEVYVITDACGDVSEEAHERAVARMVQAGARPMTALQYLLELQRDWARSETYEATTGAAKVFGGAYGLGIIYAKTMFGAGEGGH